ncbi:hypothetical protein GCM10009855_08270 [Gordonia cholesterolivorans]|uniref:Uncharacterized protein n=1 Tax=Gordonia cholesterolivorans TaxID=559625 RepID=A0ABN3H7A1_9ACTN
MSAAEPSSTAIRFGSSATASARICGKVRGATDAGPATALNSSLSVGDRIGTSPIGTVGSTTTVDRMRTSRSAKTWTVDASKRSVA